MKAVFIERHGGPEVLKYGELPDPVPNAGEIVADVHAASVNAADWKVRTGGSLYVQAQFPHVLGRDFSGVVSAVGERVAGFRPGDAVFAVCDVGQEGAYAEKIAIRAEIVARKPASLGHVEAAALAVPGLTALIAIEHTLQLRVGETILIQGGAGGVGSVAIQLAKHIGAHVISTAKARPTKPMCVASVPIRSSTTTHKTSQRLRRSAMPRLTRLAVMWRNARSQC
jgi:NADPH:quinone reductase-like Zn-dependent oxidoreductase